MLIQAAVILLSGITSCVQSAQTPEETVAQVNTLIKQGRMLSDNRKVLDLFKQFIVKFERIYANDEEIKKRLEIFKKKGKQQENYGVSWKSDRTKEETIQRTGLRLTRENWDKIQAKIEADRSVIKKLVSKITGEPEAFDFRDKYSKYVSPVADQGYCGTCWAFAFTAQLETQYAKQHDKQARPLSKAELQECTGKQNCSHGGSFEEAFAYTASQGGLLYERDYPYKNYDNIMHPCLRTEKHKAEVTVVKYELMNDAVEMKKMIFEEGPIIVYMNSNLLLPNNYSIIRRDDVNCCPGAPDHVAVLVGYGVENGVPYWILRNSYGRTFGKGGYHRIERGTNTCGIESVAYRALANGTRKRLKMSDFNKIAFLVCTLVELFKYF
ncbi:hypothetical protein WDU94_001702 [Cyamophila willieti]